MSLFTVILLAVATITLFFCNSCVVAASNLSSDIRLFLFSSPSFLAPLLASLATSFFPGSFALLRNDRAHGSRAFSISRARIKRDLSPLFFTDDSDPKDIRQLQWEFRSYETDAIQSIRSCRTISQVQESLELSKLLAPPLPEKVKNIHDLGISEPLEAITVSNNLHRRLSPNIAAAALRRVTSLMMKSQQQIINEANSTEQNSIIKFLLEVVGNAVVSPNNQIDQIMTEYALSDTLIALSTLGSTFQTVDNMKPLASKVWNRLENQEIHEINQIARRGVVLTLGPKRLVECFAALARLQLLQHDFGEVHDISKNKTSLIVAKEGGSLYHKLCLRLCEGDALSKLTASDLSSLLNSFATTATAKVNGCAARVNRTESPTTVVLLPCESLLMRAIARRMRKKNIRQKASIKVLTKALSAAKTMLLLLSNEKENDGDHEAKLHEEYGILLYTIAKEIIPRVNETETIANLRIREWAELFEISAFSLELNGSDPLVTMLCLTFKRYIVENAPIVQPKGIECTKRGVPANYVSVTDISKILAAMERWQIRDDDSITIFTRLGQTFCEYCCTESNCISLEPRRVNSIMRAAVLLHRHNNCVMKPFRDASSHLFVNAIFLERCKCFELANFGWFLFMAGDQGCNDKNAVLALAHRILEPEVLGACTPKLACRILSTFTPMMAVTSSNADNENGEFVSSLSKLFELLGEYLLTTQLSTVDICRAILAYTKASYVFSDTGIFDHLVDLMASRSILIDSVNKRQYFRNLVQVLWCCGKMTSNQEKGNDGVYLSSPDVVPPYAMHAKHFALTLGASANLLGTKDVAQSLWAIGRMRISEPHIVGPLSLRAKQLANELTSHEIANIVWAVSKIDMPHGDNKDRYFSLVFVLTRRFLHSTQSSETDNSCAALRPSAQEASQILYSLAKMDVRDEAIFTLMLEHIDYSNAHVLANALWAHRAVYIPPPQKLLDSWLKQKDRVSVKSNQKDPFVL